MRNTIDKILGKMRKLYIQTGVFFALSILVFFLHTQLFSVQYQEENPHFIRLGYIFNLGLSLSFVIAFYLLFKAKSEVIGFVFVALSLFKLVLYLVLIKAVGFPLVRNHFIDIFLPFLLGTGIELFFVYRILNDISDS